MCAGLLLAGVALVPLLRVNTVKASSQAASGAQMPVVHVLGRDTFCFIRYRGFGFLDVEPKARRNVGDETPSIAMNGTLLQHYSTTAWSDPGHWRSIF